MSWAALFSPCLPLIAGTARIRQASPSQRGMVLLMVVFMLLQLLNRLLSYRFANMLPLYHFYTLIEFGGFVGIYAAAPSRAIGKKAAWALLGIFGLAFAANLILFQSIYEVPDRLRAFEVALMLGLVTAFFYKVFAEAKIMQLEREFLFWVSLGLLILFPGNFLLEFFGGDLLPRYDVYFDVWTIRNVLCIIAYIAFSIGMLCKDPQPTS